MQRCIEADMETVSDRMLIALRTFILIDEWGGYCLFVYLWMQGEYYLCAVTAVLGPCFILAGYRYYWQLLHTKYGEPKGSE